MKKDKPFRRLDNIRAFLYEVNYIGDKCLGFCFGSSSVVINQKDIPGLRRMVKALRKGLKRLEER